METICLGLDSIDATEAKFDDFWTGRETPFPPDGILTPATSPRSSTGDFDLPVQYLIDSARQSMPDESSAAAHVQHVPATILLQPNIAPLGATMSLAPGFEMDVNDHCLHPPAEAQYEKDSSDDTYQDDDQFLMTTCIDASGETETDVIPLGADIDQEEEIVHEEHRYHFRRGVREQQDDGQVFTYDQDETGDYNSDEERRSNKHMRKRKARQAFCDSADADKALHHENLGGSRSHKRLRDVEHLPHVITFKTDRAKQEFQTIVRKREQLLQDQWERANGDTHMLRQRPKRSNIVDDGCITRTGAQELSESMRGHPAARGCLECLNIGARCSVLDNEFDWPCSECVKAENSCTPVIPPLIKAACSRCQEFAKSQKWLICSYQYEDRNGDPCRFCTAVGADESCFAHPDLAAVRQRIYLDDIGNLHLNDPPATGIEKVRHSCIQCQTDRKMCSLEMDVNGSNSTCISCDMNDTRCQPVTTDRPLWNKIENAVEADKTRVSAEGFQQDALPEPDKVVRVESALPGPEETLSNSTSATEVINILDDSDNEESSTRPFAVRTPRRAPAYKPLLQTTARSATSYARPAGRGNVLQSGRRVCKIFQTKLCHPIVFNYDDFDSEAPCNFCDDPAYAIFGLPQTTIWAKRLSDGKGWQELRATPIRKYTEPTRVCTSCTWHRSKIMSCSSHRLEQLPSRDSNFGAARERLLAGQSSDDVWCSVCCNIATYRCSTQQSDGNMLSTSESHGCGLRLCEHCVVDLGAHQNDLQEMLFEIKDLCSHKRPAGLRADWVMLKRDDVLDRYLTSS